MAGKAGPAGNSGWKFEPPRLDPEEDAQSDEGGDRAETEDGQEVLDDRAGADAEGVEEGQEEDRTGGDDLARREAVVQAEDLEAQENMAGREDRHERAEELRERDGQGGQPAAHDEAEKGPAEEEGRAGAVGLAEVDVLPPGLRVHRAELGEREGAAESDEAPGQPNGQKKPWRGKAGGDDPGSHVRSPSRSPHR